MNNSTAKTQQLEFRQRLFRYADLSHPAILVLLSLIIATDKTAWRD